LKAAPGPPYHDEGPLCRSGVNRHRPSDGLITDVDDDRNVFWIAGLAPGRLGIQWDFTEDRWRELRESGGSDDRLTIRFVRLADLSAKGGPGTLRFVPGERSGWVRLDVAAGVYAAEIGFLSPDGRYRFIAAAGPAIVPANRESPDCSLVVLDPVAPPPARRRAEASASRLSPWRPPMAAPPPSPPIAGGADPAWQPSLAAAMEIPEVVPHNAGSSPQRTGPLSDACVAPPEAGWPQPIATGPGTGSEEV